MSLPRKNARGGVRGFAHLVELDVPAPQVWRALTEPSMVRIWSGQESEIDARQGGVYRIGLRNTAGTREALIDIFDLNRRLRLIYMKSKDLPPSESVAVDDFILDPRKGAGKTSLRLLGSGYSDVSAWDPHYVRIRTGWERFMARIKVAVESPLKPAAPPKKVEPKDPPLPGLDF